MCGTLQEYMGCMDLAGCIDQRGAIIRGLILLANVRPFGIDHMHVNVHPTGEH